MELPEAPPSLAHLEHEWSKHPLGASRVRGGRNALLGFGYQLAISLELFFKAVLRGDPEESEIAFEGLSDVSELPNGIPYLCQVKLTLNPASLRDAIDEAIAVDEFLAATFPALRTRVKYYQSVRTITRSLLDFASKPSGLAPESIGLVGPKSTAWLNLRNQFMPVELRDDPFTDLVILLFPRAVDVVPLVDQLIGQLLRDLGHGQPSPVVRSRLVEAWDSHRGTRPVVSGQPGRLLRPAEFAQAAQQSDGVLTGERPSPAHVAAGYFMERPFHAKLVASAAEQWRLGTGDIGHRNVATVVWIVGGSGSGKSALLLQCARDLCLAGNVVHYLAHFPHELLSSAEYWRDQGTAVVLAVDDIFGPENRDPQYWATMHAHLYRWNSNPPLILTSGPEEYCDLFEASLKRAGTGNLTRVRLGSLDTAERAALASWYSERTGTEAQTISEPVMALATFHLELARGPVPDIGEFAFRLVSRLDELGLRDTVLSALAWNRLGIGVSLSLFAGKEQEIAMLEGEGLLRSMDPHDARRQLFHQRISSAIYDSLVRDGDTRARVQHLFHGLILDTDLKLQGNLLRYLGSQPKQAALSEDVIVGVFRAAWADFTGRQQPEVPLPALRSWKSALPYQLEGLHLEEVRDRVLQWMGSEGITPRRWGNYWQLAWDLGEHKARAELARSGSAWLKDNGDLEEWSYVWQRLRSADGQSEDLVELARRWTEDHTESFLVFRVIRILVASGVKDHWLLNAIEASMRAAPVSAGEAYAWRDFSGLGFRPELFVELLAVRLCRSTELGISQRATREIARLVRSTGTAPLLRALEALHEEPGWALGAQLLEEASPNLRIERRGPTALSDYDSLASRQDAQNWARDWRYSMARSPGSRELEELGRGWIDEHYDASGWGGVWRMLAERSPSEDSLIELGRRWILARPDSPDWSQIYRILVKARPEDSELLELGTVWLRGREDSPEWSFVWQHLVEANHVTPEVIDAGVAWLASHEDSPSWNYVWRGSLDKYPERSDLVALAKRWLAAHGEATDWPFVAERLLIQDGNDPELRQAVVGWLAEHGERGDWNYVWQAAYRASGARSLRDMGAEWLVGREDLPGWSQIWECLVDSAAQKDEQDQFSAQGRRWLQGRQDRPDWNFVWQALYTLEPEDGELLGLGYEWLDGREDRPEWNIVWQRLFASRRDDILFATGAAWLRGRESKPGWSAVLRLLLSLHPDDVELIASGLQWLQLRRADRQWTAVWALLMEVDPRNLGLLEIGRRWAQGKNTPASRFVRVKLDSAKGISEGHVPGYEYPRQDGLSPRLADLRERYPLRSVLRGRVSAVTATHIFVDLGDDIEGIASVRSLTANLPDIPSINIGRDAYVRITNSVLDKKLRPLVSVDLLSLGLPSDGAEQEHSHAILASLPVFQARYPPNTLCDGRVQRVDDSEVIIDFGDGIRGVLSNRSNATGSSGGEVSAYCVGEDVEARVVSAKFDKYGRPTLSLVPRDSPHRGPVAPGGRAEQFTLKELQERFPLGSVLVGEVIGANETESTILLAEGISGTLHRNFIGQSGVTSAAQLLQIGQPAEVQVRNVQVGREGPRISLSMPTIHGLWTLDRLNESFPLASRIVGRVRKVQGYGVFVALGDNVNGLLHRSKIGPEGVLDATAAFRVGDVLEVEVISVKLDAKGMPAVAVGMGRHDAPISVSMPSTRSPWSLDRVNEAFPLGSRIVGQVADVHQYGAFVALGNNINGLLHRSKIGPEGVADATVAFRVGDVIEVEVISVQLDAKGKPSVAVGIPALI